MKNDVQYIRVLVVEDSEGERFLLLNFLSRLGIRDYAFAENGDEALEMLLGDNGKNFQVVLTDKAMPTMDGLDLILAIRNNAVLHHIKVAMISSDLSHRTTPDEAEIILRSWLAKKNVLPVPKDGLNPAVVRRTLLTLVQR